MVRCKSIFIIIHPIFPALSIPVVYLALSFPSFSLFSFTDPISFGQAGLSYQSIIGVAITYIFLIESMRQFNDNASRWPVLLLTVYGISFIESERLLINATFRLRPYFLLASAAAHVVWQFLHRNEHLLNAIVRLQL